MTTSTGSVAPREAGPGRTAGTMIPAVALAGGEPTLILAALSDLLRHARWAGRGGQVHER